MNNKELEIKGISISKLRYGSKSYGLNSKLLIKFVLPNSISSNYQLDKDELSNELPPTKLNIGDRVGIRNSKSSSNSNGGDQYEFYGIVYRIEKSEITISCDYDVLFPPFEHEFINFSIDKLDIGSSVEKSPLEVLKSNLCERIIDDSDVDIIKSIEPISNQLNQSQLEAVKSVLLNNDKVSIIKGHSGTGKTTTMIEIILQLVKNGRKVLVCGESQISVDSILDKLLQFKKKQQQSSFINPIRIGQPSSIYTSELSKHSLDNKILCDNNSFPVIKEIRDEIGSLKYSSYFKKQHEKVEINNQIIKLLQKLKEHEELFISSVISSSNIVLSTVSDLDLKVLKDQKFHWTIIDSKNSISFIPINKLINFNQQKSHSDSNIITFTTQNRMNNKITQLSNYLLNGSTSAVDGSKSGDNDELSSIKMIDTSGGGFEIEEAQEFSNYDEGISNLGEVLIIEKEIEKLLDSGINQKDIGIITFFNSQVKLLKLRFSSNKYSKVEIGTPDQFEGREKDIIIISTVRSNESPHKCINSLEYISNQIQSSINRSKKQVLIIGNSDTLSSNNKLESLIQYIKDNGLYKSVLE